MKIRIITFLIVFGIPQIGTAYNIMTGGLWGNFTELERTSGNDTHRVRISGCSFRRWSRAYYDVWQGLANWNDPKSGDVVFSGEWVTCDKYHDIKKDLTTIALTRDLDPGVKGTARRRTSFFSNTASSFIVWIDVETVRGEFKSCTTKNTLGPSRIAVMSHEFGHGLGFNHAQSNRWGLMRTFLPRQGQYCNNQRDETLTTLHVDDVAALVDQYHDPNYASYRDLSPIGYWLNPPSAAADSGHIRATRPTWQTIELCPGDTIKGTEFSIANRGTKRLTYKRTWWSTPDVSLNSSKSVLWWHSQRVKSPGSRDGVLQSTQDLYFNDSDLPPLGEKWRVVLETDVAGPEDRLDNNTAVLSFKVERDANCN